MSVTLLTSKDAKFYQFADEKIYVGDVLDSSNSDSMSVGYEAGEDDTEVVYVTYPHWIDAQSHSQHARLLEPYRRV